jgi:hypothetical protein
MNESIKPDPQKTTTQDAELTAEAMLDEENPKSAPKTDFDSEYKMAQDMSHGSDDKTDTSL